MSGLTPANWIMVRADAVCDKIQDGTHFSPKVQLSAGEYPYVTAKNVRPSGLDLSDLTYLRPEDHAQIFRRADVRQGDVLLVKDGVNAGDAAINTVAGEISLLSSVCFLRPRGDVLSAGFLRYFLQSPRGNAALTGRLTGTAIRRIILQRVRELDVPVAPMAEQQRIVDAIESYVTRLENAVALLERVEENLKRYRASILKAAVEGRLVPTEAELARREGRSYEPASELLKRILAERKTRWVEESAEKARAKAEENARKAGQPWTTEANAATLEKERAKAAKQYKEPAALDTTELPALPEGWCWATWNQIGLSQNGRAFPSTEYSDTGIRLLRPGNLHISGLVEWAEKNTRHLPEKWAAEHPDYIVGANELVINLTAQSLADEFLGRICLTGAGERCLLNQRIARLKPVVLAPSFLLWAFKSTLFRRFVNSLNTGSLIEHMFTSQLAQFCLPLPPLAEQKRITGAIESAMTRVLVVERSAAEAVRRAAVERQAILRWAFEGKLVEQDPDDEPASVLLERIKAERAAAGVPKVRGRKKRDAE